MCVHIEPAAASHVWLVVQDGVTYHPEPQELSFEPKKKASPLVSLIRVLCVVCIEMSYGVVCVILVVRPCGVVVVAAVP